MVPKTSKNTNFWSSEHHQACLFGRVVTEVSKTKKTKTQFFQMMKFDFIRAIRVIRVQKIICGI